METVLVIHKRRGRGRFCRERHLWDLIHRDRFNQWLEGDPIEAIADKHHVTCRSIHSSIAKTMASLHQKYRSQAIELRHNHRFPWKAQLAALEEYLALVNGAMLFAKKYRTASH